MIKKLNPNFELSYHTTDYSHVELTAIETVIQCMFRAVTDCIMNFDLMLHLCFSMTVTLGKLQAALLFLNFVKSFL